MKERDFLIEENLLSKENCKDLLIESGELTAIFIASRKTAEKSVNR